MPIKLNQDCRHHIAKQKRKATNSAAHDAALRQRGSSTIRLTDDTIDVTSSPRRFGLGPDRLLWGSDWPHTQFETVASPETARQSLDAWLPDQMQRHAVLTDTPARLFRFQA